MSARTDKAKTDKNKTGGAGHPSRKSSPSRLQSMLDALQHSENFLNSIIEHSPQAMWISDSDGTLIRTNQALRNLLNTTDEELVGKYNVLRDNIVEE